MVLDLDTAYLYHCDNKHSRGKTCTVLNPRCVSCSAQKGFTRFLTQHVSSLRTLTRSIAGIEHVSDHLSPEVYFAIHIYFDVSGMFQTTLGVQPLRATRFR
jgi:hypothetical protein